MEQNMVAADRFDAATLSAYSQITTAVESRRNNVGQSIPPHQPDIADLLRGERFGGSPDLILAFLHGSAKSGDRAKLAHPEDRRRALTERVVRSLAISNPSVSGRP
jgi:hypothetical protein